MEENPYQPPNAPKSVRKGQSPIVVYGVGCAVLAIICLAGAAVVILIDWLAS